MRQWVAVSDSRKDYRFIKDVTASLHNNFKAETNTKQQEIKSDVYHVPTKNEYITVLVIMTRIVHAHHQLRIPQRNGRHGCSTCHSIFAPTPSWSLRNTVTADAGTKRREFNAVTDKIMALQEGLRYRPMAAFLQRLQQTSKVCGSVVYVP